MEKSALEPVTIPTADAATRTTNLCGNLVPAERSEPSNRLRHLTWLYQFRFFALAPTEAPGREVSIVAISETVLILAGGTAVLSILFGVPVAMRAVASGAAAARRGGGPAAGGLGAPDAAGGIQLPPLSVLGFLAAASVLEVVVPLP